MKNLIIYYFKDDPNKENKRFKYIQGFMVYQIEISLALGWDPKDIIILSNKNINYKKVRSIKFKCEQEIFNTGRIFMYKQKGIIYALKNLKIKDIIWYHDWDLIQVEKINYSLPKGKDIAIYQGAYRHKTGKPQGGCLFIKSSAIDIIEEVLSIQLNEKKNDDELVFKRVLADKENRTDYLNSTYNIGRTKFYKRVEEAEKPIKCFHLKPYKEGKIRQFLPIITQQAITSKNTQKVLLILKKYWDHYNIKYEYEIN